jgi:hypothetical protein
MVGLRAITAAILIALAAAATAADCVSDTRFLSSQDTPGNLIAGPVAWTGNALAVAKTEPGVNSSIWVVLHGEDLAPITGDRLLVTDSTRNGIAAFLWNGSELGLFYRSASERIQLQRISSHGDPIGAPVVINPDRRARAGDTIEVQWSPVLDAWVVAHHVVTGISRGIYVTLVERSGIVRSDRKLVASPASPSQMHLAVTDDGVIGVFYVSDDDEKLWLATISQGGFLPDIRTTGFSGTNFRVTSQNGLFAVVRQAGEGEEAVIRWFVIHPNHDIVRADAVLIPATAGVSLRPLALIATPDELALTYVGSPGMHLRRFAIDGTLHSDSRFSVENLAAASAVSEFPPVWSGTSYYTAAFREISLSSYLVRYCPLTVHIDVPAVVGVNQLVLLVGTASGGAGPYEFQWTISRDPGGPRRQEAIQRTFGSTGTRTITLTVTDVTGNSVTVVRTIEVSATPPPPPPPPSRRRSVRHR